MPDDRAPAELERERAHLQLARDELRRMHDHAAGLDLHAGDWVSAQFLMSAMEQRIASLRADPTATLFFGKVVMAAPEPGTDPQLYVGRRHIADAHGDPVVIDWRAPMSTCFYRASRTEPMGVALRRRFGVDRGELTAYEDEHLLDATERTGRSEILAAEIERPRVGPMRDIVATIQPEQDVIVRADLSRSICVQGAPGTGKTAVGLHRAAWLLYSFRDRLQRAKMLVIGPNKAFLDHIGAVLPSLGEVEVGHTTIEDLLGSVPVRATDPVDRATLKGDARMAEVVRRAVWSHVRRPAEALALPRGARVWRVPASQVSDIVDELLTRGVRYDAARAMLPHRLAHVVLTQMERAGDSPDDRVHDAVARATAMRKLADSVWPALDPRVVVAELLGDAEALARHAEGVLSAEEQALLLWERPPRSPRAAKLSVADLALLDEAADQITRTTSLGHVIVDEAQDLSPMQLRAVGRRCETGSLTLLGDIAQGTTPWSAPSWADSLAHLGKPDAHLEVLDRGFRVPAAVIDYAARLLPAMAPGLGAPVSVRENPGELAVVPVAARELVGAGIRTAQAWLERPGTVGLIVPDTRVKAVTKALTAAGEEHVVLGADHGDDAEHPHRLQVVPATVAKGLEFDWVVVLEPSAIAAAEADERTGLRRLYVVLTRAVSGLTVVHHEPLPEALAR